MLSLLLRGFFLSEVHDEVGTYLQGIALLGKGALGAVDAAVDKHRVVFGVGEISAPDIQLDATEIHHCMSPEGGIELLTILIVNIPIGRSIACNIQSKGKLAYAIVGHGTEGVSGDERHLVVFIVEQLAVGIAIGGCPCEAVVESRSAERQL